MCRSSCRPSKQAPAAGGEGRRPSVAALPPGHGANRSRSQPHMRRNLGVCLWPNALHLLELLNPTKATMISTPAEDSLGGHRADTWQGVQLCRRGGIQVQLPRRTGVRIALGGSSSAIADLATGLACRSDQDLLTIAESLGKIQLTRRS